MLVGSDVYLARRTHGGPHAGDDSPELMALVRDGAALLRNTERMPIPSSDRMARGGSVGGLAAMMLQHCDREVEP